MSRPLIRTRSVSPASKCVADGQISTCVSTISPGHHVLVTDFESDDPHPGAGGWVTLKIDGQPVARGHVEHTLPRMGWTEGLDVGRDLITAVSDDYEVPDVFTGVIRTVTVNIK
jgi:hypothetical protein